MDVLGRKPQNGSQVEPAEEPHALVAHADEAKEDLRLAERRALATDELSDGRSAIEVARELHAQRERLYAAVARSPDDPHAAFEVESHAIMQTANLRDTLKVIAAWIDELERDPPAESGIAELKLLAGSRDEIRELLLTTPEQGVEAPESSAETGAWTGRGTSKKGRILH